MNTRIYYLVIAILALQSVTAWADDSKPQRFDGSDNGRTTVFSVSGPWLLDWSLRSEFPLLPTNFEMRLHDGESDDFVGTIVQLEGIGRGLKLFDDGGEYRIEIVASNIAWELAISEVSEEHAARLKRHTFGKPTLQDSVQTALRHVPGQSFTHWQAEGSSALLLFDEGEAVWRATFMQACPGLESAEALSFVTPTDGSLEEYDSVLLNNGTRCYFDRVVPTRAAN